MMRPRRHLAAAVLLGALVLPGRDASAEAPLPIAVIVNARNKLEDISLDILRSAFLKRRKRWSSGKPMMVVNARPKSPLRVAFDKQALKLSGGAVASYWIKLKIRGEGTPPLSIGSPRSRLRLVQHQEAAMTYLPLAVAKAAPKVRILRVGGKLPGEAGYPLVMPTR